MSVNEDFKQYIIDEMKYGHLRKNNLPEARELLLYMHGCMLITGRIDIMYCNAFIMEAFILLANAIFLYEDGYFDCAYYSIRQAGEVLDSMLYLANSDEDILKKWKQKERFPMDSKIKEKLEKMRCGYDEIKNVLGEYFDHHKSLIEQSHKIIHKQGFDTFYIYRKDINENKDKEIFLETLKYTLGIGIILFGILEPLSLALADDEINARLNFNFMTEAIDYSYFEKFLGLTDVEEKIKNSNYYKSFISQFENNEIMNAAVYSVVREEAWNIDALDEIEKQLDLLSPLEKYMFKILKSGIKVSNFYYDDFGWYLTTYKSNYNRSSFGGAEFKRYRENRNKFNQPCKNVFISVVNAFDVILYLEHNDVLTEKEIAMLSEIERVNQEEYKAMQQALKEMEEQLKGQDF